MRLGYHDMLDFKEIYAISNGDEIVKANVINRTNCHLCKQLLDNMPTEFNWEKCYHVKVELLDGMNVVTRIDEVPIEHTALRMPRIDDLVSAYDLANHKFTLKERLKIFIKGEL